MSPRSTRFWKTIIWLGLAAVCGALTILAGGYLYLNPQVPAASTYQNYRHEAPLRIYSSDGALLGEFGERRLIPVRLVDVPMDFRNALVNTEDKRFYEHSGIDYISLANDTIRLLLNPTGVRTGASTITMQLAKNVSLSLEQTFIRKFKEMLLALKIEQELTKDEILELYINIAPFGKRAYGAQAAAYTYYGKPLDRLNVAQLAMLAGIPKRPEAGNPVNGPEWAVRRRNLVLRRMFEQGSIDQPAYEEARDAPITAAVYQREIDLPAPHVAEWARQELEDRYGPEIYHLGHEVFTTVDSTLQARAIGALRRGLIDYDRRHGYRGPEDRVHIDLDAEVPGGLDAAETLEMSESPAEPGEEGEEEVAADDVPSPLADPRAPAYLAAMEEVQPSGDLFPAIVTHVGERTFAALTKDGEEAVVAWEGMRWARPYIDTDAMGPRPRAASDIVAVGDLVRLQMFEGAWRLAQLPDIEGAIIALRPTDGAVLALSGGFDFARSQYDHALQAARQPGSGFKPFIYSAALANGVTPASIFVDAPLVFEDETLEQVYRPRNDDNQFSGPMPLRRALYRSRNLVSIRVLLEIGVSETLDHVKRFGFDTSTFPRNSQLAIGGGTMAVTPISMARAYAMIANGGYAVEPHVVGHVTTQMGEMVLEPRYPEVCTDCAERDPEEGGAEPDDRVPAEQAVDGRNTFILHSMLKDVVKRGTGRRALELDRSDLAGKTGTTNDAADTWFNGFAEDIATTVWVGFDDYRPVGRNEYGSTTPLSIWIDFMRDALAGRPEVTPSQPEGVITLKIDPATGRVARPAQEGAVFEYFLEEFAPTEDGSGRFIRPPSDEVTPEEIF
ncbi:MAG: PBP1A family penicillin-binding protein [Gammaproteobacteria bacterium]|nr:PBP1A family penicillin-binding protein [Gammaproteobacteria bacterium]